MSCDPTPTNTLFADGPIQIVDTFSVSIKAATSGISSIVIPTCLSSLDGACVVSTETLALTTFEDRVERITVPVALTEPGTASIPTLTLFAPCPSVSSFATGASPTASQTSPFSASASATPFSLSSPSPSVLPTIITPTVTTETVSSPIATELYGGSTFTIYTAVSTVLAESANGTTTIAGVDPTPQQMQRPEKESNLVPILGGTLGGFFSLVVVVGVIAYVIHRAKVHFYDSDHSEAGDSTPSRTARADPSTNPKPYVYGSVGGNSSRLSQNITTPPHAASLHHSHPSSSSLGQLSRPPSGTLDGRPDSMIGLLAHHRTSSSIPALATREEPPPEIAQYLEFGARPTSVYSNTSALVLDASRRSRSSLAGLSTNLQALPPDYSKPLTDAGGGRSVPERVDRYGHPLPRTDAEADAGWDASQLYTAPDTLEPSSSSPLPRTPQRTSTGL